MIENQYALKAELNVKYTAKCMATVYRGQPDDTVEKEIGFPIAMVLFTDQMSFVEFCKDSEIDLEVLIIMLRGYADQLEEDFVKEKEVCQQN